VDMKILDAELRTEAKKRGRDRSKERKAYECMRSRCYNPNNPSWDNYGGRGIRVCERWLNSYPSFLYDMGEAPEGTSLERNDVNKDYGPDNCCWDTPKAQARNRRDTPFVTYKGKVMSLSAAAEAAGCVYVTVYARYIRGWPEDRLFEKATHRRSRAEWVRPAETPRRPLTKPRKTA
jgi:hypothetical protein